MSEDFDLIELRRQMFWVKFKGEVPPTDEDIIWWIWVDQFSLADPSEKVPGKVRAKGLFREMDPEDQVRNVWNLGYVSSDKEESNDTDKEEEEKYMPTQAQKENGDSDDEEIDVSN